MQTSRWVRPVERALLTIFLAWLAWLPMPFGSVVEVARLPLIVVPLALCAAAASIRFYVTRERSSTAMPTRPLHIWLAGSVIFLAVSLLQLVPLRPALLRALSPESFAIWSSASRVATLAGVPARSAWPITTDPQATVVELLRLAAIVAAFLTSALLIRNHARRRTLAVVLCATALFEAFYGLREAALQRYEIWGWVNRLIFDRVTGTFVNPNHFAHYIAIVLPMALFLGASLWRKAGTEDAPFMARLAMLVERHVLLAGFTVLATVACLAAILLSQSRGALISVAAGIIAVAAMLPGRRIARVVLAAFAGLALVVALALFLGPERTVSRFTPGDMSRNAGGRRLAIETGAELWQRFSVFGSGLGTFSRVVWMEQDRDHGLFYHHAHNDYLEIAVTAGTVGMVIAVIALAGGYAALRRMTFGQESRELTSVRRAFQTAALLSLSIAMVHALFDFNLFIPSNPATLAAILGAAVASVDHDRRTRR